MKKNLFSLLILVSFLVLIFFINPTYSTHSDSRFIKKEVKTSPGDVEGWRGRINAVGGERAHEEFAKSVEGLREETQHDFMHGFAGVLYEEDGIASFPVCDSQFFYACFHEYAGRATADRGVESAAELNQVCMDSFAGNEMQSCQHGIGHGLQAIYGYTQRDLDTALDNCSKLSNNDISGGGCYGGIFMEYNLRTMLSDEGRVRTSENFFSPCDSVSEKFQEACTYWNPQWWRSGPLMYLDTTGDVYEKMGDYCRELVQSLGSTELERKKLRRVCFGGIGGISAPEAEFDIQFTALLCDVASVGETERAICRANAAYRTIETPDVETALHVCDGLEGDSLLYCRAFATSDYDQIYEISESLDIY